MALLVHWSQEVIEHALKNGHVAGLIVVARIPVAVAVTRVLAVCRGLLAGGHVVVVLPVGCIFLGLHLILQVVVNGLLQRMHQVIALLGRVRRVVVVCVQHILDELSLVVKASRNFLGEWKATPRNVLLPTNAPSMKTKNIPDTKIRLMNDAQSSVVNGLANSIAMYLISCSRLSTKR